MKELLHLAILILFVPMLALGTQQELQGTVTMVSNNGTIEIQNNSIVRLADIYYPVAGSIGNKLARAFCEKWLLGKQVSIDIDKNSSESGKGLDIGVVYLQDGSNFSQTAHPAASCGACSRRLKSVEI